MNQEEQQEEQHSCKEAKFVKDNRSALVQRIKLVMPLADDLLVKDMIHKEKYSEIKAGTTNEDKMRVLLEAVCAGGDEVITAFYDALCEHQPFHVKDLSGENRKRKISDPECQVPTKSKKLNTENERQTTTNNNFLTPAPQINVTTNVTVQEQLKSPGVSDQKLPAIKTERKPPAIKKKPPATKKEKKPPATKKEKKPPATKKKPPATKKEKKPLTIKKKQPPATKKDKKPPAPKKKKPSAPKKKKPPAPKKK